jgi:hypothetical protein
MRAGTRTLDLLTRFVLPALLALMIPLGLLAASVPA